MRILVLAIAFTIVAACIDTNEPDAAFRIGGEKEVDSEEESALGWTHVIRYDGLKLRTIPTSPFQAKPHLLTSPAYWVMGSNWAPLIADITPTASEGCYLRSVKAAIDRGSGHATLSVGNGDEFNKQVASPSTPAAGVEYLTVTSNRFIVTGDNITAWFYGDGSLQLVRWIDVTIYCPDEPISSVPPVVDDGFTTFSWDFSPPGLTFANNSGETANLVSTGATSAWWFDSPGTIVSASPNVPTTCAVLSTTTRFSQLGSTAPFEIRAHGAVEDWGNSVVTLPPWTDADVFVPLNKPMQPFDLLAAKIDYVGDGQLLHSLHVEYSCPD